jgi:hypothetical protein
MKSIRTEHNVTARVAFGVVMLITITQFALGTVRRNPNGSYTARYSVTCAGGTATDSDTGNTPRVSFRAPGGIGCNAGTRALAERQVGTGKIIERAVAVRGDRASAGDFSLPVVGVLPLAVASLDMQQTNVNSTEADFLLSWKGDLGTAGEVMWFDLSTGSQLGDKLFSGGTSQTLTVPIIDSNGVDSIGFNAEVDAASINTPTPEPASLLLVGSGLLGVVRLMRRRSSP